MNAACSLSITNQLAISIYIYVPLFQNSANNNDNDVDNNTKNKDCICHDTNDSESSSEYESDIYLMMEVVCGTTTAQVYCSIRGCGLVRVRGGRFRRCGRVGAHGRRADAVARVANQPFWSDIAEILKTLTLTNCFMKMKGQIVDFIS